MQAKERDGALRPRQFKMGVDPDHTGSRRDCTSEGNAALVAASGLAGILHVAALKVTTSAMPRPIKTPMRSEARSIYAASGAAGDSRGYRSGKKSEGERSTPRAFAAASKET